MIYLIYVLCVPSEIILTLIALLLAPILPLFASPQEGFLNNGSAMGVGSRLPSWLNWFQTWDNSLEGDATFEYINGTDYIAQVKWLLRNPLPCFALSTILNPTYEVYGDNTITDGAQGIAGSVLVKASGLFQFVWIKPISATKCIYINLGWNLRAITMGTTVPYIATFSFSPRIARFA